MIKANWHNCCLRWQSWIQKLLQCDTIQFSATNNIRLKALYKNNQYVPTQPYINICDDDGLIPGANCVFPANLIVPFLCPATITRSPTSISARLDMEPVFVFSPSQKHKNLLKEMIHSASYMYKVS